MSDAILTKTNRKLWSIGQIAFGTFFAGPIGGCFFISQNFKALGEEKSAQRTFWSGLLGTIIFFAALFSIPEHIVEKVPNFIFPVIYTSFLVPFAGARQKDAIKHYLAQGGKRQSHFKLIGISSLFLLLLLGIAFGMILLWMCAGIMD